MEDLGRLWRGAFDTGDSILATSATRDESVRSELATLGHKDVLIVPLHLEGRPTGAMMVDDRQGVQGQGPKSQSRRRQQFSDHWFEPGQTDVIS